MTKWLRKTILSYITANTTLYTLGIWVQVKGHAARNNTTLLFTANKVLQLPKSARTHVTAENWASVIKTTKRVIMYDCDHDIAFDNLCIQELIINITKDSSLDESSINDDSDDSC